MLLKRATDKAHAPLWLLNTVNYYNRDNWTELPAMGYEADEGTKKSSIFNFRRMMV